MISETHYARCILTEMFAIKFLWSWLIKLFYFSAGFQEEIVLKDKNPSAEEENVWNEEAYHKMCMKYINAENDRLRNLRYLLSQRYFLIFKRTRTVIMKQVKKIAFSCCVFNFFFKGLEATLWLRRGKWSRLHIYTSCGCTATCHANEA